MLEEVFYDLKPPSIKRGMLSAAPEVTRLLPQIESKISFFPFIDYLKNKRPAVSDTKEIFYNYLIQKFEAQPFLAAPVVESELINDHSDILELLGTSLFPLVTEHDKNSFAFAVPYHFDVFHYSECFNQLFTNNNMLLLPEDLDVEQLKAIHCSMIYEHALEKFYGVTLNESQSLIYPVVDKKTSIKRYYKIHYDRRFVDLKLKGTLPLIQDCAVCLNIFRILDLEQQLERMPLDLFEAEGFGVWVAEDVTTNEALDNIKKILLRQDEGDTVIINKLKQAIQSLVGINDLQVGLMPFLKINEQFILNDVHVSHSLIAKNFHAHNTEDEAAFKMYTEFLSQHPEPVPISILNEEMLTIAPFLSAVYNRGVRSYIHYPMQNSNGFVGALELASNQPNSLNGDVLLKVEPLIPFLSIAMQKNRDNFENQIEKVIKEKFTALQLSVEWKFAEVAWDFLSNGETDTNSSHVIFDNVYPLYGAIDIRNSSLERTHAIQKDLKEHLSIIDKTLDRLEATLHLDLLEGLKFKNENFQSSIKDNMLAEDEVRINEFILYEVEPMFAHLQKSNKEIQLIVEDYFSIAKDNNSLLYRYRNEFEETLATINSAILAYLEKEEIALQKTFPHYFEKYRTDGVEYNIYIGQSIAPAMSFDMLYLKNIRLWQLKSMAEAARITHQLLPSLKVPLQTTQLILIHSQSISISFRKDERRFDVEGSYNIRYEVIKKRLDKARIKLTGERLTQPGRIALVYSNQKEVQEYQEYIAFLQNKNILAPDVEMLELEELQGINGLKAVRVTINLHNA